MSVTLVILSDQRSAAQTSDEVAEHIAQVQMQADATAEAWRKAGFESEELAAELMAAEKDLTEAAAVVAAMTDTLSEAAVRRYIHSGSSGPDVLFTSNPMTQIQIDTLSRIATAEGTVDLDEYADVDATSPRSVTEWSSCSRKMGQRRPHSSGPRPTWTRAWWSSNHCESS